MTTFPNSSNGEAPRRRVAPLTIVLGVVVVFFCGILIFVFIATKRANPVMLDQQGHPTGQSDAAPRPAR